MFDLDGTLADTLADIAAAGNHMLASLGRPPIPIDQYRYLVGQGTRRLVCDALQTDQHDLISRALDHYFAYYHAHPLDHSRPYPGITDLLDELVRRRLTLAILSNKPHTLVVNLVNHLFNQWPFFAVLGDGPDTVLKPDPARALQICAHANIPPANWLYVGDTRIDMLTGKAAGMFTLGVTWGFRDESELRQSGADAIIHHPLQLLDYLAK
jgi:phosphoglycolate phosphatase